MCCRTARNGKGREKGFTVGLGAIADAVGHPYPDKRSTEMEHKTFKREIAICLAIFLCFIAWKAAMAEPVETLKVIIWPIMLFVGAAFGMQWASKQTGLTIGKT